MDTPHTTTGKTLVAKSPTATGAVLQPRTQPLSTKRRAPTWRETHAIPPIDSEEANYLINRELSWLAFNERVLAEAENPNHPLLERLRFVAISADNLDEFFMVRVAGLKHASGHGDGAAPKSDYIAPDRQLVPIDARIRSLMRQQQEILPQLWDALAEENIQLVGASGLSASDRRHISHYIEEEVIHVITPQTLDPAHPFPFIANRGFGMFLELTDHKDKAKQALIMLPPVLKRFIRLPNEVAGNGKAASDAGAGARFITLEEAILLNLDTIFPRHKLAHHVFFRLLRDSEIDYDEEAEDLVATFENALRARRRGNVIALQLSAATSDSLIDVLTNELAVADIDIHFIGGMIGLADLSQLCTAGDDALRFPPFTPRFPQRIRDYGGDCFAAIRAKDIVVHHPYESFDVVLQFLRQAAQDPQVISIRQTLYRTLPDSPIVRALIMAAEAGKSVMAMVEIKARFDEEVNIRLARDLERAGVQVVYGFVDLKTHAKLSLVVRQEEGKLRTYAHCGTGNYHPVNARIYTDLSFFTQDSEICSDIVRIFNYMTSYVKPSKLHKVVFSPVSGRQMFKKAVKREIKAAQAGKPAGIWMKLNALVDTKCIDLLYQASQAGVAVDLVVRGICCLRPGLPGLSDNIRVRSVIGRFLEHSRIYVFANGEPLPSPRATVYISSADLMPRNLDRRVEVFMPIENPTVHRQILDQVMYANINDTSNAWLLQADGSYVRHPQAEAAPFSAHNFFMTNPSLSGRGSEIANMPDNKPANSRGASLRRPANSKAAYRG